MFGSLDFIYMPSADVAADLRHFTEVAGCRLVFAIEAFGTRVAMIELSAESPAILLAGHLEGEAPILVYRVEDLAQTGAQLAERGWKPEVRSGIPHGPLHAYRAPGGQRFALYQLTRPEAAARLEGRRDF
ncbi:MAG: VOC family protein [Solirubrobacterales bacterium]